MSFVFPLLLSGLVFAGLPVLLHFLVRKKPTTLLFPAYRFLMQKKKSNTRNLRLRHLLLLLLRIALIVLFCLALSRPRLFHEAVGLSREKPVALVLIFDTTPSMGYQSGTQTRLDLAKTRALELLDQLPEECRVLILDAADPAGFAREDWLRTLDTARQRIQSLTIRPESVPVNTAIDEAHRRFENTDDLEIQRLPHFVCLFSDRTRASWDFTAGAKRGTDVQFLFFDVGIDEPIDLALPLAELVGSRQSFLVGDRIPLNVVVQATGQKSGNTLIVQVGDKMLAQQFHVDPGTPQTLAVEIDTNAWDLKPGFHQAEARLESETDSWPRNNKRFVTFKINPKPRVLVLTDDLQKSSTFARALAALQYDVVHRVADEKIEDCQAVFLVGVAAPTEALWANLAAHVEAGRGVGIFLPGDKLKRAAYQSAAAKKVMPAQIVEKIDGPAREWNVADADFSHPFLAPYRKWLVDDFEADFITTPRTATKYWRVEPDQGIVHFSRNDAAKHPAIVERSAGKQAGKVLLVTTPIDHQTPDWNNYDDRLSTFFISLSYLVARHLCAEPDNVSFNHQFGQRMPTVTKSLAFPKYLLTSGDFSAEIRFDDKERWTPERLPKEGNFVVSGTNPDGLIETIHKFSMNIAPEESDLTRVSVADLEESLGKNSMVPQDRRRSIVETLGDSWDEPVELLPWLLLALLLVLALENLLANRFYKSEPEA